MTIAQNLVLGDSNYNYQEKGVCFEYPNIAKLNLLLTYKCNAACQHCITQSNPQRTESLNFEYVCRILEVGTDFGKKFVSFTGGEPFTQYKELLGLIKYAKTLGYYTCVDTNAFWGHTIDQAQQKVKELLNAGLDALFPTADPYHLPFVPLESVINVVKACDHQNLTCEINFYPGPNAIQNEAILDALDLRQRGYFSDGLSLYGNDVTDLMDIFPTRFPFEMHDKSSMYLSVTPRGEFIVNTDISYSCKEFYNTPFYLGNFHEQDIDFLFKKEQNDPIISIIRQYSPSEIHTMLIKKPYFSEIYAAKWKDRRFYSETEYWLSLFQEEYNSVTELVSQLNL
jgi:organic radical activating enzyme